MAKKFENKRKQARGHLNRHLEIHESKCYWCEISIVRIREIPIEQRVARSRRQSHIYYLVGDGLPWASAVATIDHVWPLSCGGSAVHGNIVPSCYKCNWLRAEALTKRGMVIYPKVWAGWSSGCGKYGDLRFADMAPLNRKFNKNTEAQRAKGLKLKKDKSTRNQHGIPKMILVRKDVSVMGSGEYMHLCSLAFQLIAQDALASIYSFPA